MGRISSGVGIVSGLNVDDIVSKLIEIESRPRTLLQNRVQIDNDRKTALLSLSATLLGLQSSVTPLKSKTTLQARTATSSLPNVLEVTATSSAALGSFQVRAVRQAQTNRLVSSGLPDRDTTPVGAGTLTIKLAGFVVPDTRLDQLNGGAGVRLGKIQITDRSGAKAVVDLSTAQSIGDVLTAINQSGLGVTASVSGDAIKLSDTTGLSTTSISVAEVAGGATGSDLGLVGGTFGSGTLTGTDIVKITSGTRLSSLNGGLGVRAAEGFDDLRATLADGTTIDVNLSSATTIGDVLTLINSDSQNTGTLTATIGGDGERIVLTDTSGGGGTLSVAALNGSNAARDLGILGSEQTAGVLSGKRVLAGLNTVLLSDLRGGQVEFNPGNVDLQDRTGATATVDFSAAESLADVVSTINASGLALTASINAAGNGINVAGTSGSGSIAIADATGNLATSLKINVALVDGKSSVASGDLDLRSVSENTLLSKLNGGGGIAKGRISIKDSTGASRVVNLSGSSVNKVSDVLLAINSSGAGVHARVNDTGDGILVTDNLGGDVAITDVDSTTAADLNIAGSGTGQIDGAYRWKVDLDSTTTLDGVLTAFSVSKSPVTASITNDGSDQTPYRLVLGSKHGGLAGRLLVDTGTTGLTMATLSEASDALVQLGGGAGESAAVLVSSSTNTFSNILPGVSLNVLGTSTSHATITIGENTGTLSTAVSSFVTTFNTALTTVRSLTKFDTVTLTGAILHNDSTAREIENLFSTVIGRSYGDNTKVRNLSDLGISVSGGLLSVDQTKLSAALESNPDAVRDFLSNTSSGLATKLSTELQHYTQQFSGAISGQVNTIDAEIANFEDRISQLNIRLDIREQRIRAQFLGLEQAIAKLQNQQNTLSQLSQNVSLATSQSN